MNLQQLNHLLVLAETGSFSRAADKLHLTQPALSRSIQALEDEIGGPLIDRTAKHKELTPLGALVFARASRIGLEVSELRRSATLLTDLETGTVRLGLGPAPAAMLSVPLLAHMMGHHPMVNVQLSGGPAEQQLQALRARTVDALIIHKRDVPHHDDLRADLFPGMRLGFLCRAKHPLLKKKKVTLAEIRQFPVAASGARLSNEVLWRLDGYADQLSGFSDAIRLQSEEISCLIQTVRTSDAVFLGVLAVALTLQAQGDLVELPLAPPLGMTSQFAFVTLDGRTEAPALQVVRAFCAQRMRDAGEPLV